MRVIIKIMSFFASLFGRNKNDVKGHAQHVPKDNYPMF